MCIQWRGKIDMEEIVLLFEGGCERGGRERLDAAKGLLSRKQPAEAIKASGECGGANAS